MAGSEKPTASEPEQAAVETAAEPAARDDRQRLDEQTLELIERSLVGAGEMVARHEFADKKQRGVLRKAIRNARDTLDPAIGSSLAQASSLQVQADQLLRAIDALRELEAKEGVVEEKELVNAVLRLLAILEKVQGMIASALSATRRLLRDARKGDTEAVISLLDAGGVDANSVDKAGHSALMEAAQYQRADTVSALLARGADPNLSTGLGWSALKFAAMNGDVSENLATLQLLLDAKPDLETRSLVGMSGNTVLHNAAESGFVQVVEALLEAGAKPEWKNATGQTALDLALSRGHFQVVRLFDADAGDACQVRSETQRCGSAAVCGWLRSSGAAKSTVSSFEKAGVTGADLLTLGVRNLPGMGVDDAEEIALVQAALDKLEARRKRGLISRCRRGATFSCAVVGVGLLLAFFIFVLIMSGLATVQAWEGVRQGGIASLFASQ